MWPAVRQQVLPDDHSKLVPLLPIPNRTVKRLSADDSADSRVKVGHRQALIALNQPSRSIDLLGFFFFLISFLETCSSQEFIIYSPSFLATPAAINSVHN